MAHESSDTDAPSTRTQVVRRPLRGHYDRATIEAILDEGLICHVGFAPEPVVLPTTYVRIEGHIYLHGAVANRMLTQLSARRDLCVAVTLLDGLVLARSAFHHSMNYRSVVLFGRATPITERDEKRRILHALVERLVPGRMAQVRPPSDAELDATLVVAVPTDEASAKVRTGPPIDAEEDYALPCWAGELPIVLAYGPPVADPRLTPSRVAPEPKLPPLHGNRPA